MERISRNIKSTSAGMSVLLLLLLIFSLISLALRLAGLTWLGLLGLPADALLTPEAAKAAAPWDFYSFQFPVDTVGSTAARLLSGILAGGLRAAMLWLGFLIFREIARDATPFRPKHIRRLWMISFLYLFSWLLPGQLERLVMHTLRQPFQHPLPEVSGLVACLLWFCLVRVYEYGCMLELKLGGSARGDAAPRKQPAP